MSFSTYTQQKSEMDGVITFDTTPTPGCLIIVCVSWGYDAECTGVTDSAGNTYHPATARYSANGLFPWPDDLRNSQIWYAQNCAVVASHTVTAAVSTGVWQMGISEWNGQSGSANPVCASGGYVGKPTVAPYDLSAGTLTPTMNGCLMIVAIQGDTDVMPPGSATLNVGSYWGSAYAVLADMTPYVASMSLYSSTTAAAAVALFLPLSEAWVPVADYTEKVLDAARYPGGIARVTCDLWAKYASPQPTTTARLVSLLTTRDADGQFLVDAEVGRSAVITSAVPADASFPVTLAGIKRHRLEQTSDTPKWPFWCSPDAEVGP